MHLNSFMVCLMVSLLAITSSLYSQGVTFLIKGKVVDAQKKPLSGVQVIARDGDEVSGKSKTTINGEFIMTLKPGRYYQMSFERNDLFLAGQDFRVPDGTAYQEINQDFQVRVYKKGDTIQQFPLFPAGQSNAMPSPLFTMIPEMLKRMPHLKIKILVSEGKLTGKDKKSKTEKKTKGKKGASESSIVLSLYDRRVQEISSKLMIAGAPQSRIAFEKATLKVPHDVAVLVASIASEF